MTSITGRDRVGGGIAHALSPECTPASSTCSITPPMSTSPVASRTASTSTSMASSRKRSTSTGRARPARPPAPASPPRLRAPQRRGRVPEGAERGYRAREAVLVVHDLHGAPSEHVARAHQRGNPMRRTMSSAPCTVVAVPPAGCGISSRAQRVPPLAVLGQVDRLGRRPEHEVGGQAAGQLERRLSAQGHDHPGHRPRRLLGLDDVEDVLQGEGGSK